MPLELKVSDNAYQEKLITLNGNSFFFTYTFNTRDQRWYFDMVDRDAIDIISGVKIMTNQDLTSKYINVASLIGGEIYCVNQRANEDDITRDNFGNNKQFVLWYFEAGELNDLLV